MKLSQLLLITLLLFISSIHGSELFPFGRELESRDLSTQGVLESLDDGFVELNLPNSFLIDGHEYNSVFINVNGLITFVHPSSSFEESEIEGPYFAPFWGDVDLSGIVDHGNKIYFRMSQERSDLDLIEEILSENSGAQTWRPSTVVVATWYKVGYFMSQTEKLNTFQTILATDGKESFTFNNYPANGLNWFSSEQGQEAKIGYRLKSHSISVRRSEVGDLTSFMNRTQRAVNPRSIIKTDGLKPQISELKVGASACFFGGSKIRILGRGFSRSSSLSCSFTDGQTNILTPAQFVAVDEVSCENPLLSSKTARVAVSLDGTTFSNKLELSLDSCILSYSTKICSSGLIKIESFPLDWSPENDYSCILGSQKIPALIENDLLSCPADLRPMNELVYLSVEASNEKTTAVFPVGSVKVDECGGLVANLMEACSNQRVAIFMKKVSEHPEPGQLYTPSGNRVDFEFSGKVAILETTETGLYSAVVGEKSIQFEVKCGHNL